MTAGEKFHAEFRANLAKLKAAKAARERVREAAPDLLAALKRLVALWESEKPEGLPDGLLYFKHWDDAKAAIEKAGEWPAEDGAR
jgi:hypothetical protein